MHFLDVIHGPDAEIMFQTFDDKPTKRRDLAVSRCGSFAKLKPWLDAQNRSGAGIFHTVNRTDGRGRKKSNIIGINAFFADIDGALPASWDLPPTAVIGTPAGGHPYWKLIDHCAFATAEQLLKLIAKKVGGDPKVAEIARVLRVPGFLHQKAEPAPIVLLSLDPDRAYTLDEIVEAFGPLPTTPRRTPVRRPPPERSGYGQSAFTAEIASIRSQGEGNRNNALYAASCNLRELALGGELDWDIVIEELLDAGISTGLSEAECRQTIESAIEKATTPRSAPERPSPPRHLHVVPPPTDDDAPFDDDQPPQEAWNWELSLATYLTKDGDKLPTREAGNVAIIVANDPAWKGCLAYDEFRYSQLWLKRPREIRGLHRPEIGPVKDVDVVYVQHAIRKQYRAGFSTDAVQDAIDAAARMDSRHPVRDYLNSLTWDGVSRVDTWTQRYLGAPPGKATSDMGRWWLVSAIARVFKPGCRADHTLILEGPQGLGKSHAAQILAGQWYQGTLEGVGTKDAKQGLVGYWIVEIGELDAFRGRAATQIKDFLTQPIDAYRPSYGRRIVERPRQCVFIGTTNDSAYLRDATGARRFWPIACTRIDAPALRRDRDQLWAETLRIYHDGERWWPVGKDENEPLSEIQEDRYEGDAWEELIAVAVINRTELAVSDVMDVLKIPVEKWDRPTQIRVAAIMRRLGWQIVRERRAGARVRRYVRNS
jgi:predicted P-loop ATPase